MDTQNKLTVKEDIRSTQKTPPSTRQAGSVEHAKDSKAGDSTPYTVVTEAAMKEALIEARSDIFIASQLLGITAIRLNRAIQVSAVLQATVDTIQNTGKGIPEAALHAAIEERISLYRVVGLDALHDLAAMPIDQNSAQNQVKLAAAARLAGGLEGGVIGGEMGETFRQLAEEYQKHAPRLRVIRERTTMELLPADEHRVIDAEKKE